MQQEVGQLQISAFKDQGPCFCFKFMKFHLLCRLW